MLARIEEEEKIRTQQRKAHARVDERDEAHRVVFVLVHIHWPLVFDGAKF